MGEKKRRLPDGRTVSVHRNGGVRKVCGCARRIWAKCPHPWHFSFRWGAQSHRLSLDRHTGKRIISKADADAVADKLRSAIRAGTFEAGFNGVDHSSLISPADATLSSEESLTGTGLTDPGLTFAAFAEEWRKRRGYQLVRSRENDYRIRTASVFLLPGDLPGVLRTTGNLRRSRPPKQRGARCVRDDLRKSRW
jgi:hypothetical protein